MTDDTRSAAAGGSSIESLARIGAGAWLRTARWGVETSLQGGGHRCSRPSIATGVSPTPSPACSATPQRHASPPPPRCASAASAC